MIVFELDIPSLTEESIQFDEYTMFGTAYKPFLKVKELISSSMNERRV